MRAIERRIKYFPDRFSRSLPPPPSSPILHSLFDRGLQLAIIHYSTPLPPLSSPVAFCRAPHYKLLFRYYPGALIDLARAFIPPLKLSTAPRSYATPFPFASPFSVGGTVRVLRLSSDGLRSIESKIESRSPWKYLRLKSPSPITPVQALHEEPFAPSVIARFRAPQALACCIRRPSRLRPLIVPSLPPHARARALSFFFFFLLFFLSLSAPAFFPHCTHPRLRPPTPPRKAGRNWPFGHERPRWKAARESELRIAGKDWGLCAGDRVIAVAVARDPREWLPYITGATGKYKGHGALPSTPPGARRPSRRSELYSG